MAFKEELQALINRHSLENFSDTPDFVLAEYINDCVAAFDRAVTLREKFYGRNCGSIKAPPPSPPTEQEAAHE